MSLALDGSTRADGTVSERIRFRIIPGESKLRVTARSNVHPIHGETDALEGYIDVALTDEVPDLTQPVQARLELQVDRIKADNSLFEGELHRRLDIRRYPRIVGELTRAESAGQRVYLVFGQLTFHGTTRRLQTSIMLRLDDRRRIEAEWSQAVDIREFNLAAPRVLLFKVEPVVEVSVKVVAEREEH